MQVYVKHMISNQKKKKKKKKKQTIAHISWWVNQRQASLDSFSTVGEPTASVSVLTFPAGELAASVSRLIFYNG